ncbi:hypothetical protein CG736_20715 [Kitasatospora sp. CB02891]|nr:hypothetical protein CG736_20715 [Kitasatospora sp. CB02891]
MSSSTAAGIRRIAPAVRSAAQLSSSERRFSTSRSSRRWLCGGSAADQRGSTGRSARVHTPSAVPTPRRPASRATSSRPASAARSGRTPSAEASSSAVGPAAPAVRKAGGTQADGALNTVFRPGVTAARAQRVVRSLTARTVRDGIGTGAAPRATTEPGA